MTSTDEKILRLFARQIRSEHNLGDGVSFSVAIDEPEAPTYLVKSRAYADAIMSSGSGMKEKTVARDLDQPMATRMVVLLNEASR